MANREEAVTLAGRHRGLIEVLLTDVITESALVRDGVLEKNTVLPQKPERA